MLDKDRAAVNSALSFSSPREVLNLVADHIERQQNVSSDNIKHYALQRDEAVEDKRTQWKRAERAEGAVLVATCFAIVGWLVVALLLYLRH